RQHHSFIRLPDDNYKPRVFDPRSGFNGLSFMDYASPINEDIRTRYITRHRLEKKDPTAAISEPVEPITYYVDRGAPEPIKSALIEGASWWNQAFEAAGYKDAFIVKEMPADADPMDVRYNLIQWVHRSTRGWSYGASVADPRTGEIIKGHVSLGSLRVRQDYLIAQGLFSPFRDGSNNDEQLMKLALARLRQLSAHEVGHTIGLAHNFASSTNDRASVMDYPHPLVVLSEGEMSIDRVYDNKIGEWDKRTILYGYADFTEEVDEDQALQTILHENDEMGLVYISDRDARPQSGAHPYAHLWDNGADPVAELYRLSEVRQHALNKFGLSSLKERQPMGTLENVLVPLYLSHRYQVEAVAKLVGGLHYTYAVKDQSVQPVNVVDNQMQKAALNALLETVSPSYLEIPESIISLIPPMPIGYSRGRENFKIKTGNTFDPLSAAESAMHHTFSFILNKSRMARINEYHARGLQSMGVADLLNTIEMTTRDLNHTGLALQLALLREKVFIHHLMRLIADDSASDQVKAITLHHLNRIKGDLASRSSNQYTLEHKLYLNNLIERFIKNPKDFKFPSPPPMPDGSPIGCSVEW
ncbi:MAG: zinc-dependent metalloprotease, partial [Bacteroidia bacterium]|nr:zinc-dependent metalloprotease [Bacteroidia bacterium]